MEYNLFVFKFHFYLLIVFRICLTFVIYFERECMFWIIETILFSILFIFIIHYLYDFLKLNLTTPLVKDLARTQSNKYEEICNILKERVPLKQTPPVSSSSSSYEDLYSIQHHPMSSEIDMKSELKQFLKLHLVE